MAFQSVPNVAQVKVKFLNGPENEDSSFALYARATAGEWDSAALTALATAVSDAVKADYVPVLSNQHDFVGVEARDLEDEFPVVIVDDEPAPVVGTLASAALPANVAVRVTFLGAAGAPPSRGGINLLPPGESQVDGSVLTGAAETALSDAAQALKDSIDNLANVEHVIVSRYAGTLVTTSTSGKKFREPIKRAAGVSNNVASIALRSRVDTQRKRLTRTDV